MQAGAQTPAEQTGSGETDGYVLVWQDLFDGESLNPLRWDMGGKAMGAATTALFLRPVASNIRDAISRAAA